MSDQLEDLVQAISDRLTLHEARYERTFRYGKIRDASDIDLSDPANPVARIHHADDAEGEPVKGPFVRYATWAGDRNHHNPPSVGQQFLHVSPDGEMESGLLIPLGASSAIPSPETDGKTHVDQFGQVKRTLKQDSLTHTVGGVQVHTDTKDHKVTAPGTVQLAAGDPAAANSSGAGSLTNFPHELNRILQGVTARLDQHDHLHAAHHDQMSQIVDLAIPKVPALVALQSTTLNHKPEGLQKAAEQVTGQVPQYASNIIQQAVDKLLASPLGAVPEIVRGDIAGQMGGLLGQIGSLIGGAGLSGDSAASAQVFLGQAQAAVAAAAAGGTADLDGTLSSLSGLASGSPIADLLGDAVGQLRALMGSTEGLMGGLNGLVDGQVNASKGTIKSVLFGGYGG